MYWSATHKGTFRRIERTERRFAYPGWGFLESWGIPGDVEGG
jgi:hypothetical protein